MWFDVDRRSAKGQDGDFRAYLMHEFGHWVVAQEQDPAIGVVGLGLYGLTTHVSGRVLVGAGGGVRLNYGTAGDREGVIVDTAGVVAERLDQDAAFVFNDPLKLFHKDSTFDDDFRNVKGHLAALGIAEHDSTRFPRAIELAMNKSAAIIKPLIPRLREQVRRIEHMVVVGRLSKIEIMWTGEHASMLTGKPDHHYEIKY
jgi:hypothetical protein